MELLPAAALLARVDRAWAQRDTLADPSRTGTHYRVGDGDYQSFVGSHPRGSHPTVQPGTASVGGGHVPSSVQALPGRRNLTGGSLREELELA